MSKGLHTPLPWFQDQCAISGPGTPKGRYTYIAICERKQGVDPAVAVANASLIVRAVNSYGDLLQAAQTVVAMIENLQEIDAWDSEILAILKPAVARAKEDAA